MNTMDVKTENSLAKLKKYAIYGLLYAVLIALAIVELFPFVYMALTSFKSFDEMLLSSDFYLFPKEWSFKGYFGEPYYSVFEQIPFWSGFKNTMIIEASFFFVGLISDVLAAYSFSKIKFRGRNALLLMCLVATMVPFVVTMMPQYTMFSMLGLTGGMNGSLWPLVLPHFMGTVGVIFYLERYMKSLPDDIFEAGTVDGLGHIGKIFYLAVPMSVPAIVVQCVFMFLGIWNDVLMPDLYLKGDQNKTLQVMLQAFSNTVANDFTLLPPLMAGATLSSIPLLVLYLSCQRLFVDALAAGAVKG